MKRLSTIVLTLFWLSISAYAQKENALSAEQALTQMFSVYASCNSYSDEGSVEHIFITKNRTWTNLLPFTTAFVRPSLFYFEYKERVLPTNPQSDWKKYMAWEDQDGFHRWWSIDPIVRNYSLLALALPGAVCGLASYNIPFLLRDDLKRHGHRFRRVSEFKIVGEEPVNGKIAYKLEGNDRHPQMKDPIQPITIWVDKQSYLLLKIYQKLTLQDKDGKDFEVESTTIYHPKINIEIPQEKFKVTIPVE